MSDNTAVSVELKEHQVEYLETMVKKYELADRSKALRILITFAMENPEQQDTIFSEIRCTSC